VNVKVQMHVVAGGHHAQMIDICAEISGRWISLLWVKCPVPDAYRFVCASNLFSQLPLINGSFPLYCTAIGKSIGNCKLLVFVCMSVRVCAHAHLSLSHLNLH
jgi:hypothetical protein